MRCTEQARFLRETSHSNIFSRLFCLNWDFSCQTIYHLKNSRCSLNWILLIFIKLCWRGVFPSLEQDSWKLALEIAVILLQVKILAKITPVILESPGRSGAWQAAQPWAFPRHWHSSMWVSGFWLALQSALLCSSPKWSVDCVLSTPVKGVPVNGSCCISPPKYWLQG